MTKRKKTAKNTPEQEIFESSVSGTVEEVTIPPVETTDTTIEAVEDTVGFTEKTLTLESSITNLIVTESPAPPSRSLEQIADEANFKVRQGDFLVSQGVALYLEAGQDLLEAKTKCKHGEFQNWLQVNCKFGVRRAQKYMQVAERFGNKKSLLTAINLNITQAIELLALPAGKEEEFIEQKAAEGVPVETMTTKKLKEEVAKFKSDYEAEKAKVENLFAETKTLEQLMKWKEEELDTVRVEISRAKDDLDAQITRTQNTREQLESANKTIAECYAKIQKLESRPPVEVEVTKEIVPSDYEANKAELAELQARVGDLQRQLEETTAPSDYDATKKELAELQKRYAEVSLTTKIAQKLDAISDLIRDIMTLQNENGVEEYAKTKPERFRMICADFTDFLEYYYKE